MSEDIQPSNEKNNNPVFEEAKALSERMEKAMQELKKQADRIEQLKSNEMLSGTGGARPPMPPAKPESPKEYRARVMKDIQDGKYDKK